MKLFGFDWLAIIFSLLALHLLRSKNRFGFVSFMAANLCWIAIGVLTDSIAILVGNALFLAFNFKAYRDWLKAI